MAASIINSATRNAHLSADNSSHLPNGACNFRELTHGTKTPICGCRRFWLNETSHSTAHATCFCGHHACFHNAVNQQSLSTPSSIPQPPSQALPPPPIPTRLEQRHTGNTPEGYKAVQHGGAAGPGLGIRPESNSQGINTRVWDALNHFARAQEQGIYSEHTSQLPSTAVISVNGDAAEYVPQVMQSHYNALAMAKPSFEGSATEVATPSLGGTPDLRAFVSPGQQAITRAPAEVNQTMAPVAVADSGHITQSPPNAQTTQISSNYQLIEMLRAHSRRLDTLEGVSFSQVPVDDIYDRFEHFDGRLQDIEQWRDQTEEERQQMRIAAEEQTARNKRIRRLLPHEASSFASDESFDENAAVHAEAAVLATIATNAELGPRLDLLEDRMADLERAALPSYANPWTVHVILLPWGRSLRGIWFPSAEPTEQPVMSCNEHDEWSGARSQTKVSFRSTDANAWTTESIEAWAEDAEDWLSPKACGLTGAVYSRLASRGLVRDVTLTAPDSRHILDSLVSTFSHILPARTHPKLDGTTDYQGLEERFLPLRKVRKSTRLRFLSHAEMTTSATWTASFLDSSVFMKIDGQRRLYITTPHAYMQENDGTSWQQLRKLPMRDENGDEFAAQVDPSVAIEACWSFNDKLDRTDSLHSSFASNASGWVGKNQHSINGPLTPALSSQQAHHRTSSRQSSTSAHELAEPGKRRYNSFEQAGATSDQPVEVNKRRRLSKSPEAERRGVGFTPRRSREPPSPFLADIAAEEPGQVAAVEVRKPGSTPVAYATPHSATHHPITADIWNDGDTEPDPDMYINYLNRQQEEEWQGMDAPALNTFTHRLTASAGLVGSDEEVED